MKCRTPEQWNFLSEIWGTMDWTKLSMLFKWTVILTLIISTFSVERGRYQRGSGCNPQNQTVHHGWLSNQYGHMAGLLKYTKQELYTLRESVYQSHALRILDPSTCARVREYRLNKTRKRGQRGGRQVRLRHRRPTGIKSDNNTRSDTNVTGFSVQCVLVNIQSIKNKEYLLRDELDSINAEFSAITETWLDEHDSAWVDCCQLNRDGYKILTSNRQTRRGGGLALVYKDSNTANVQSAGVKDSFEYMICTMTLKGFILTVILIYHPPYSNRNPITNSTFIDEFSQFSRKRCLVIEIPSFSGITIFT